MTYRLTRDTVCEMVDPDPPRLSGEHRLWAAVVFRAVEDAIGNFGGVGSSCTQKRIREGTSARDWFQERSYEDYGWGWVSEILGLSEEIVRAIEQRAGAKSGGRGSARVRRSW